MEKIQQHVKNKSTVGGQERFQVIYDELFAKDRISNEVSSTLNNVALRNHICSHQNKFTRF